MNILTNSGKEIPTWIDDAEYWLQVYFKLKDYEDLEEQGRLIKLPCKVGSTVYAICTCEAVGTVLDGTLYGSNGGFGTATGYYCPYELSDNCPHIDADDCDECKNVEAVFEDTVDYINITEYETIIGLHNTNLCVTIDEILDCEVPYMEYVETDRINFEEQIEEWLWDEMGGNDKDTKLSEVVFEEALKETKAKYEPYWKKVITIYANN